MAALIHIHQQSKANEGKRLGERREGQRETGQNTIKMKDER